MKKKIKNGFTLVELLAVITILGILALITVPTIQRVIAEQNKKLLRNSSEGIIRTIQNESLDNLGSFLKYEYFNDILRLTEKNGVALDEAIEVETNGKIEDGQGVFYVYIDGDVEGNIYDGINCATLAKNSKEVIISEGECSELNIVTAESLIADKVTSGDGLYLDELDDTYRYKGANPNNYVRLFDGEEGLYRIIAIEEQGIKVISNQTTNKVWSDIGNVLIADCTSETCPRYTTDSSYYCSNAYNLAGGGNMYKGCNVWYNVGGTYTKGSFTGIVNSDSYMLTYLRDDYYETYFKKLNNVIVQDTSWNIGGVDVTVDNTEELLDYENDIIWNGKIGLMNASDYVRSQLPISNGTCYAQIYDIEDCKTNNWIHNNADYNQWTINADVDSATHVLTLKSSGNLLFDRSCSSLETRPVIYLKSNVAFNSGSGTEADPYILAN